MRVLKKLGCSKWKRVRYQTQMQLSALVDCLDRARAFDRGICILFRSSLPIDNMFRSHVRMKGFAGFTHAFWRNSR